MWKFFAKEFPKPGQIVDIIWTDGTEDVSRWTISHDIDWKEEIIPLLWRLNSWENE